MTTAKIHLLATPVSQVLPRALCGRLPDYDKRTEDVAEATCTACCRLHARARLPSDSAPKRDPWRYTGERLSQVYSAIDGIARRVNGDYACDDRPHVYRDERFGSVAHAVGQWLVWRLDGPGYGASNGAAVIEHGEYGVRPQWTRKARAPRAITAVDDLVHVDAAIVQAYDPMPLDAGMSRYMATVALVARCGGTANLTTGEMGARLRPGDIAEQLELDNWGRLKGLAHLLAGVAVIEAASVVADYAAFNYGGGVECASPNARQVGRVTRHGWQRVYEALRERELIPQHQEREQAGRAWTMATTEKTTLRGWKDIAAYLEVSEATARRWAQEHGFPAYAVIGGVESDIAEIEAWRREQRRPAGAA